jgi:glutamate dehydrogenase (NADP+)
MNIEKIMSSLEAKHPGESEYLQAVKEVLLSIEDIYNQHQNLKRPKSSKDW